MIITDRLISLVLSTDGELGAQQDVELRFVIEKDGAFSLPDLAAGFAAFARTHQLATLPEQVPALLCLSGEPDTWDPFRKLTAAVNALQEPSRKDGKPVLKLSVRSTCKELDKFGRDRRL